MKGSNITVISNVYPRNDTLERDKEFISKVQSRPALEKLVYNGSINPDRYFTKIQNDILHNELKKCIYNEDGDFTWGGLKKEGKSYWGCRCTKVDCKLFKQCRKGLSEEIVTQIKKQNKLTREQINLNTEEFHRNSLADLRTPLDLNLKASNSKTKDNKNTLELTTKNFHLNYKSNNTNSELEKTDFNIDKIISRKDKGVTIHSGTTSSKGIIVRKCIDNQENVIKALKDEKILVNAGPGTGKTYTLIERLKHLIIGEASINPQDIMVLSFSRAAIAEIYKRLKNNIKENCNDWELNMLDIRTFDSFATYVMNEIDAETSLQGKDYDERIEMVIELIKKEPYIFENIEHVIVDEIQDLVGIRAQLVQTILDHTNCGFTLLGDLCQSIYDYQIKDKKNSIDSELFNNWLHNKYKDELKVIEFTENRRQKKELSDIAFKIRKSIQNDSLEVQKAKLLENIEHIKYIGECQSIASNMEKIDDRNLCFLCRTNGQALKVSKYLRDQGVRHKLLKPSTFKVIEKWIGEIIVKCQKAVITYEEFKEEHTKSLLDIDEDNIQKRWQGLKGIEGGRSSKLVIEDLAVNFEYKKNIYEDLTISSSKNIVVSTIHRAKGREFDEVVLLDDSILSHDKDNEIKDEIKVYYVAITRPKENIFRINFKSNTMMKKVGTDNGRWIQLSMRWQGNKKYKKVITNIEVGKQDDIEATSFVNENILESSISAIDNQKYIIENVKKNDEIVLKKRQTKNEIIYDIYHFGRKIGVMSSKFSRDVYESLKEIYEVHSKDAKYFPDEISEVYIDEICTYVKNEEHYDIPNYYRENGVWIGVILIGLGKFVWYGNY